MIQVLLFALFPIALAQYGHGYGGDSHGYGGDSHGYGHGYEQHYSPQPYKFGYDVKDSHGSTLNQKEEGDSHGNKKGSYGYTDGHGIYRQVDYVADKHGFRATIKTNEPGTSDEDPADVHIDSHASKHDYHSAPYKSQSYSAPSYQSYDSHSHSSPSYGGGYSTSYSTSHDSHGYGGNRGYGKLYGGNGGYGGGYGGDYGGGYARSHSIPAVYYAKGY